jgi:hypothetical protein
MVVHFVGRQDHLVIEHVDLKLMAFGIKSHLLKSWIAALICMLV